MDRSQSIAYFTMEIALDAMIPTYSGGLGVLAGDTIRAAADAAVPMVALSLLYRKGYFFQRLDPAGRQTEEPVHWRVDDFLEDAPERATVSIEGRAVQIRAWIYDVTGIGGFCVPVVFLDTDLPENVEGDRALTDSLYGGDQRYRLSQEIVLGIGGLRMLRKLGFGQLRRFHMNEGHASLLALELLDEESRRNGDPTAITPADVEGVRSQCIFTTHTPVPSGHDQFPMDLVRRTLERPERLDQLRRSFPEHKIRRGLKERPDPGRRVRQAIELGNLNMTYLALNLSGYVNGVAKKHAEVSRLMFADYGVDEITNGVHAGTWAAPAFRDLFERHIPGWKEDNFSLRYALSIPCEEVWAAHLEAKRELLEYVNGVANAGLDLDTFTIGFGRRATAYKRPDLLFTDTDRLKRIAAETGPIQIVYSGKAHPRDAEGKKQIQRIFAGRSRLEPEIRLAWVPNYDVQVAGLMTSGSDLWLNTPEPPNEASGTSGMKAALNGVPSLSVLDGWWIEGCIEGVTGWAIGPEDNGGGRQGADAASLYDKLERAIVPAFYRERTHFRDIMRHAIALNGSFFNTQRMLQQYVLKAYFR